MPDKKLIYMADQDGKHSQETKALLASRGFEVKCFTSGEAAMKASEDARPDLFITSLGLKGKMDGLQYVRALKARESLKEIPIILLTSARRVMHMPFSFAPDPRWFPVFDVVEKPARPDYLFEVIDKALACNALATSAKPAP